MPIVCVTYISVCLHEIKSNKLPPNILFITERVDLAEVIVSALSSGLFCDIPKSSVVELTDGFVKKISNLFVTLAKLDGALW